ncbi:MAG: hypothetical protein WBP23_01145 [Candidatus Saccharimonadales bacterium]
MVNRHSQTGFAHIVLLVTVAVVLAVAATLFTRNALAVRREASLYAQADAQVQKYIGDISKKFPGKVTSSRGCSYTHEKYSKGQLGCGVDASYEKKIVDENEERLILDYAGSIAKELPWEYKYDNVRLNPRTPPDNYISVKVFNFKTLVCGITYKYQLDKQGKKASGTGYSTILVVVADCSGTARAEHYPIGG